MLLIRATVFLGLSTYHWFDVRAWIRLSKLFTDFFEGRMPIYGRPPLPKKRPTLYPRKSTDPSGNRAIRVLAVFTSNPSRVIKADIRPRAAAALPGRQQMT